MFKKTITTLIITLSLLFMLLAGCSSKTNDSNGQTYEVKRGDLDIVISTDGSLNMPNNFDLRFGTIGKVREILVKEGDKIKQGSLLAFLDDTTQKNAIRTALFNMQSAVNSITEGTCGSLDLPNNYPELSVLRMFEEAQKDMDDCISYIEKGQYKDAGFELGMTYFDIEVCEELLLSRTNAEVLAGGKSISPYYANGSAGTDWEMWESDSVVIEYLQKYRERLLNISRLMMHGAYEEITPELESARQEMIKARQLVENTIHVRGRTYLEYPDVPTSLDFLQSSLRSLQELDKYMAQGNPDPVETAKAIYMAKLNLMLGRDTLENQTLTYDWTSGSNWKTLQQYNLNVQNAETAFLRAKQDIMNTVIIAPSDGMVVSVDLKKGYILSAQDYSSKTAVKLVDTSAIKFTGLVDEIDIMKVKAGQKARLSVDAVPNKIFTGKVTFISPFGTKTGQVIKFAVTIELDPTDVELRGSLSATADIDVYSAKNVLMVPTTAIMTTPMESMVTVINEVTGKPEPRKITLGQQSFQYAEVLDGLKEGEKILATAQIPIGAGGFNPSGGPRMIIR